MDPVIQRAFKDIILDEAARLYGIATDDLSFIGGFMNFVYEFGRDGDAYVLRFTHDSHRTYEMVCGEVEWINYLAKHGVSVARAVPSVAGKPVETLTSEPGYFSAMSPYRKGG